MGEAAYADLNRLLKEVSRSFFLTLRILPARVRPQIGLAYLLARATDTVADTNVVPVSDRLATLANLRARILGHSTSTVELRLFTEAAEQPHEPRASSVSASAGERTVLLRLEEFLKCVDQMPAQERDLIRSVLATIISGQELDLRRFGNAGPSEIVCLRSDADLDDYIYRVAGSVGDFWTRLCRMRLFPGVAIDEGALIEKGIRFGKGLQLVNILRDLPADLRQGRCYIPQERLESVGLRTGDLLQPENYTRLQPVYGGLLALANGYLEAGWQYTNLLPRHSLRLRLACAWPVLIGVLTLGKLRNVNVLNPSYRVKVTRREVRKIMVSSFIGHFVPPIWRHLFTRAKLV